MYVCIYICMYIYRERERERGDGICFTTQIAAGSSVMKLEYLGFLYKITIYKINTFAIK